MWEARKLSGQSLKVVYIVVAKYIVIANVDEMWQKRKILGHTLEALYTEL